MRIQSSALALLLSTLLSSAVTAVTLNCGNIKVDEHKYDLSGLGGVHEIYHVAENETAGYVANTTYVLNICQVLVKAANRPEGKCGMSKNVCGFVSEDWKETSSGQHWAYSVAGLDPLGHGAPDPQLTRLKAIDESREGLRIRLSGGEYKDSPQDAKPKPAAAVIDFQCDPDRSGLEGLGTAEDEPAEAERLRRREDAEEPGRERSLQFQSFGPEGEDKTYVLKLDWRTRYACDAYEGGTGSSSSHWGFFTWLIIILFLCIAAYLIFGSWLNYNRYGARGWDLLPHGDAIRDVPYIFQDWLRRVVNTLQGGGSRGGYSAV
ncbi:autophagy protein Atg27 [Penicillium hispanicum]|uniref:autophagy protein Atg27 n=1 Tax=Penicillium hispanicum TaxID=1080232 RepID=UPI002541816B|nr:autophagy protein Atg27 [Penicillium hispanicum]KAJ5578666.1 autophagy protein Atg27 [Penicillium hispanicum]